MSGARPAAGLEFDPAAWLAANPKAKDDAGLGHGAFADKWAINKYRARLVRAHLGAAAPPHRGRSPSPREDGPTPNDERGVAAAERTTYTFDEAAQTYTFRWKGRSKGLVLTSAEVDSMIKDYVEDGLNLSMHEVAVRHGVTRREFDRIRVALSLTKRHEPFAPEVLATASVDELADQTLAGKRRNLAQRVERESLADVRRAAAKWYAFQGSTLDPFREVVEDLGGAPAAEGTLPPVAAPGQFMAHFHASDLHYGLRAEATYGGGGYDREEAKRRALEALADFLAWLDRAGGPAAVDYVLMPAGGDFAHADNIQGKTTSTKNQMDMDGLPEEVLIGAIDLFLLMVDEVRRAGYRVHVETVPGNHDYYTSIAIGHAARVSFGARADSGVTFGNAIAPYAHVVYGASALVLHHGHGLATASALADQLGSWARKTGAGYRYGYAITGNLHHVRIMEDPGLVLLQQPSPCEPDRYHALGGWTTSRPAVASYLFSAERGLVDVHMYAFD